MILMKAQRAAYMPWKPMSAMTVMETCPVKKFGGLEEKENEVEINAHIASGGWGYDAEWNIIDDGTIQLLCFGKSKGCKGKGNGQFKACFDCGKKGQLASECRVPQGGKQPKGNTKGSGGGKQNGGKGSRGKGFDSKVKGGFANAVEARIDFTCHQPGCITINCPNQQTQSFLPQQQHHHHQQSPQQGMQQRNPQPQQQQNRWHHPQPIPVGLPSTPHPARSMAAQCNTVMGPEVELLTMMLEQGVMPQPGLAVQPRSHQISNAVVNVSARSQTKISLHSPDWGRRMQVNPM